MASLETTFPPADGPNTALALVLPESHLDIVQPFRSYYDAAAVKWPPHINLFYPFVHSEALQAASEHLAQHLPSICETPVAVKFSRLEIFGGGKKRPSFLVLRPDEATEQRLRSIYDLLCEEFPDVAKIVKKAFKPHMTIGQMDPRMIGNTRVFERKAEMLCNLLGSVGMGISTLKRSDGKMKYIRSWGLEEYTVKLSPELIPGTVVKRDAWTSKDRARADEDNEEGVEEEYYDDEEDIWVPIDTNLETERIPGRSLTITSYNCFFDITDPERQDSRWISICKKIISANSTVVCLQEVSDDLVTIITETAGIRNKYPYLSHSPEKPLLRYQNCFILSSVPFTWEELASAQQKRSIAFAKFESFGYYTTSQTQEDENPMKVWHPLIISNVHLAAFMTDEAIKIRTAQTQELKSHLQKHYPENPVLIVGDTNIPSDQTIEYAVKHKLIFESSAAQYAALFPQAEFLDAWDTAGEGLDGTTYDPINNHHAKRSSSGWSDVPKVAQRYDRIYLRKQGGDNLLIREVRVTRDTEKPSSDHYMLTAKLAFLDNEKQVEAAALLELPQTSLEDADLRKLLADKKCFPSDEDDELRQRAIRSLEACLKGLDNLNSGKTDETFQLRMVPVGSFGLGTYDATSDIDCLVVGTISTNLFWKVAKQRIKRWRGFSCSGFDSNVPLSIKIVRYVDAAIPMLILLIGDCVRIDLQYCTAVRIVESWESIPFLPMNHSLFNLTVPTLKKLQAYRDMLFILNRVPNLATFRLAYRFLKLWASNKGIYSSKFGFLGGVHITLLLARICMLLPPQASASQVLVAFFKQYSTWNWGSDTVVTPNTGRTLRYQRATRDKMVILTINTPAVNVSANATSHTVNTLTAELEQACAKIELDASFPEIIGSIGDDSTVATEITPAVGEFLTGFNRYIKVDIQFWGSNKQNGRGLVGWVESRLVMLLVELGKQTPNLTARVWPQRFHEVKAETQNGDAPAAEDKTELRGFYLIGLAPSPASVAMSKEEKKIGESAFSKVLQDFESRVRNPDKFDEKDSWIHVSCVKPTEFTSETGTIIQEDKTMVWDGGEADEEGDTIPDEDSSEDEEEIAECLLWKEATRPFDSFFSGMKKYKKKKSSSPPRQSGPTAKLRPSHEVFNRIKWDARFDPAMYVVGYEDRFRGVLEIGVDKWKTEMSDEEFVPMHRVVYFKDKKSGEVVWDREKRIDKVFGSGKNEDDKKNRGK